MKGTLCTIYRSARETELYLYLKKDVSFDDVPEELLKRMGETSVVMTILLTEDKKLARVNATQVLADIEDKGYFLQLPPEFNPQMTYGE